MNNTKQNIQVESEYVKAQDVWIRIAKCPNCGKEFSYPSSANCNPYAEQELIVNAEAHCEAVRAELER